MTKPHAASWDDFWASNAAKDGGGCLPDGYKGIDAAQQAAWRSFAKALPKGARLLDLATGDGRVMGWIMRARRDIKPTGCDLAPKLPPPPRGAQIKTGVPMEQLPFPDGSFAALTSQFGFEYSEVDKAAAEAARVLRPGGTAGLLMHRGDGPILAHNLKRREQIEWALQTNDLVGLAKRSLKSRALGIATIPSAIVEAPAIGQQDFGTVSAAWEIAEAVKQTMILGARDNPANVARLLDTIAAKAQNELGRIASLEVACATADDTDALLAALHSAGLEQIEANALSDDTYPAPFATFRTLRRTG